MAIQQPYSVETHSSTIIMTMNTTLSTQTTMAHNGKPRLTAARACFQHSANVLCFTFQEAGATVAAFEVKTTTTVKLCVWLTFSNSSSNCREQTSLDFRGASKYRSRGDGVAVMQLL